MRKDKNEHNEEGNEKHNIQGTVYEKFRLVCAGACVLISGSQGAAAWQ